MYSALLIALQNQLPEPNCDVDELYSVGLLAIGEAMRSFNPDCGTWGSWVSQKIKFRILDHKRSLSTNSRSQQKKLNDAWRLNRDQLLQYDSFVASKKVLSLDAPTPSFEHDDDSLSDRIACREDLERELVSRNEDFEKVLLVKSLLAGLKPRDRYIVREYFWSGRGMLDIGRSVGVNESRISQIIGKSLKKMRILLNGGEDAAGDTRNGGHDRSTTGPGKSAGRRNASGIRKNRNRNSRRVAHGQGTSAKKGKDLVN